MAHGTYRRVDMAEEAARHRDDDFASQAWTSQRLTAVITARPWLSAVTLALLLWLSWLLLRSAVTAGSADYLPIPLSLLLSNDTRPVQTMAKLDSSGAYLQYDDITTVMKIRTQLHPQLQAAHDIIATGHRSILSPLPVSSYHVTLAEVIGLKAAGSVDKYNALITEHHHDLERLKYQFQQQALQHDSISFRVTNVSSTALKSGVAALVEPATEADSQLLQSLLQLTAKTLGSLYVPPKRSHASLAYKVPNATEIGDVASFLPVIAELEKKLLDLRFVCDMPILSAVHDMLKFDPV